MKAIAVYILWSLYYIIFTQTDYLNQSRPKKNLKNSIIFIFLIIGFLSGIITLVKFIIYGFQGFGNYFTYSEWYMDITILIGFAIIPLVILRLIGIRNLELQEQATKTFNHILEVDRLKVKIRNLEKELKDIRNS